MGLLDRLTKKRESKREEVEMKMQELLSLVKVYFQAAVASEPKLGVTINMLPDLKIFKNTLKIATQGRLGFAEKAHAKKLLMSQYGYTENMFSEFDSAVRRVCHKQQDVQSFFIMFSNLSNDLLTVITTQYQWKLAIPSFFKGLIRSTISSAIKDIMTKTDWTAADAFQACARIRKATDKLKFSESTLANFVYPIIMISKGAKVK